MKRAHSLATLLCGVLAIFAASCSGQDTRPSERAAPGVRVLADLNWRQIAAFNRSTTLVLLTVGMLEEHGPHLPIAADTIGVEHEARHVADSLQQTLTEWNVVLMPTINYGVSGANQIGNAAVHPGTYALRQSTLRAVVADVGAQLAQNGFKWIFVLNGHGAPTHHLAVNEASDFVSDVFGATMLNVSALFTADPTIQQEGDAIAARHYSAADLESFGRDPHAGVSETSGILFLRPDLVDPSYRNLPSLRVQSRTDMIAAASAPGWPGYFSSPARATSAYGRDVEGWWIRGMSNLILGAVRGENLRARPRWPDALQADPAAARILEAGRAPERAFEAQFERWLERHQ